MAVLAVLAPPSCLLCARSQYFHFMTIPELAASRKMCSSGNCSAKMRILFNWYILQPRVSRNSKRAAFSIPVFNKLSLGLQQLSSANSTSRELFSKLFLTLPFRNKIQGLKMCFFYVTWIGFKISRYLLTSK